MDGNLFNITNKFLESSKQILVDADAWTALYNSGDTNHRQAVKISQKMAKRKIEVSTSYFILIEAATVISRRLNLEKALAFLNDVLNSGILIFEIDHSLFLQAKNIYSRQTSKNISFNDVCNIALIKQHNLAGIFSFDKHYKQNGILRVGIDKEQKLYEKTN